MMLAKGTMTSSLISSDSIGTQKSTNKSKKLQPDKALSPSYRRKHAQRSTERGMKKVKRPVSKHCAASLLRQ